MGITPIQPTSVIFRLPDAKNGTKVFAEVGVDENGVIAENATAFGIDDGDTFHEMSFSHVVLAVQESDDQSLELCSFELSNPDTGEKAIIHEIMETLHTVIPSLIETYIHNTGAGRTLQ